MRSAASAQCRRVPFGAAVGRRKQAQGSIYAALPRLPETVRVKFDVPGMPAHSAAFLYVWDAGTAR
jgi:hypothetical protein